MPERSREAPARPAAGRLLAAAAALLLGAGCSPEVDGALAPGITVQPVGGTWAYTSSDLRLAGGGAAVCGVTGLVLQVEQLRHNGQITQTLTGTTSGGTLACSGELSGTGGPIDRFPLVKGNTFNGNIAFSIGSDDWRSFGTLSESADSASGQVWLRHGSIRLEGTFVARRTSR
ncbi:MAG TPA: hypothetical protein VF615_22250 [Longimicrobiaceae bacterium]|jgi:hypothetical protein